VTADDLDRQAVDARLDALVEEARLANITRIRLVWDLAQRGAEGLGTFERLIAGMIVAARKRGLVEGMEKAEPRLVRGGSTASKPQYDEKTDRVVYGDGTDDFTSADWLRLARAAFDQACVKGPGAAAMHKEIEEMIKEASGDAEEVGSPHGAGCDAERAQR
jgi:hypothetical protein